MERQCIHPSLPRARYWKKKTVHRSWLIFTAEIEMIFVVAVVVHMCPSLPQARNKSWLSLPADVEMLFGVVIEASIAVRNSRHRHKWKTVDGF